MMPQIHEHLPLELFSTILHDAARSSSVNYDWQTYSHNQSDLSLQVVITLSSVCKGWRQIVTSMPALWANIEIRNFLSPNRFEAMTCLKNALLRSTGRFYRISLDFSSLKDTTNAEAEDIIHTALNNILENALTVPLSSWRELCITVASHYHMEYISDFFMLTASPSARNKLCTITTLRLRSVSDPHSALISTRRLHATVPSFANLPYFNTLCFRNLTTAHLTDTRIIVFPSNLRQSSELSNKIFELHLDHWTSQIDGTTLIPATLATQPDNHNRRMPAYHIITNSPMNLVNPSLCSAIAVTLIFPHRHTIRPTTPLPTSPKSGDHPLEQTSSPCLVVDVSTDFKILDIGRLFLQNNMHGLRYVELTNITSTIWLTLLALLKPLPPNTLSTTGFPSTLRKDLFWECLVVRFAPSIPKACLIPPPTIPRMRDAVRGTHSFPGQSIVEHPSTIPPGSEAIYGDMGLMKMFAEELGFDFDFRAELGRIHCTEDFEILMKRCLMALTEEMLPNLKIFSCYDPDGRHWRTQTIWNRK